MSRTKFKSYEESFYLFIEQTFIKHLTSQAPGQKGKVPVEEISLEQ